MSVAVSQDLGCAAPAVGSSYGPRSAVRTVVTDDGAEIVVHTQGAADAPATVVLCHGWTMAARDWRPHVDALARPRSGFPVLRVVAYDQRGHGRSTRGGAVLDMALLGRDLGRVLDAVSDGYDGPVVLVGHSMGGMAIQQLAVERPELFGGRVAAVGLFSTCLDGVGTVTAGAPPARRRAHAGWRAVVAGLLRSPGSAKAVHRLLTGPLTHPSTALLWRVLFGARHGGDTARTDARALRAVPPLAVAEFYAALTTHDCAGRLTALGRVPTRVLVGARDYYTPPEQAARLTADIPGAALQTVPQQGHDLPYERPVLVLETVHALLREMAGGGGRGAGVGGGSRVGGAGSEVAGVGSRVAGVGSRVAEAGSEVAEVRNQAAEARSQVAEVRIEGGGASGVAGSVGGSGASASGAAVEAGGSTARAGGSAVGASRSTAEAGSSAAGRSRSDAEANSSAAQTGTATAGVGSSAARTSSSATGVGSSDAETSPPDTKANSSATQTSTSATGAGSSDAETSPPDTKANSSATRIGSSAAGVGSSDVGASRSVGGVSGSGVGGSGLGVGAGIARGALGSGGVVGGSGGVAGVGCEAARGGWAVGGLFVTGVR
ncbi:alpha/beta fold hydrolase [Streptomyces cylindrosporus]|uniref:alpha/beta fold hydrolase n=1 Tax=Streptomyces cylindrosporus TaxID=2927583 RepID=UPI0024166667|nr:alpha/beta fold hydrolase [Streptomyces cylindrosporus]